MAVKDLWEDLRVPDITDSDREAAARYLIRTGNGDLADMIGVTIDE